MQTSPLGEYQARLQLLRSFAWQLEFWRASGGKRTGLLVDDLAAGLHSVAAYYGQFLPQARMTLCATADVLQPMSARWLSANTMAVRG
jgi:hypothetical protein